MKTAVFTAKVRHIIISDLKNLHGSGNLKTNLNLQFDFIIILNLN